jgi:hypothetical protein
MTAIEQKNAVTPRHRQRAAARITFFAVLFSLADLTNGYALVTQCVGPVGTGLCSSASSPCTVASNVDISPGAVLDCSGMDINITQSNTGLTVTNGSFSLYARNLTLGLNRLITATPSLTKETGVRLSLSGTFTLTGRILAQNGGRGSSVSIDADGAVDFNGPNGLEASIDVTGSASGCDGGEVYISGGSSVRVARYIDASGSAAVSTSNINFGGTIIIDAIGDVTVEDELRAWGRSFEGGYVSLSSGHDVLIDYRAGSGLPKGLITVEGKNEEGEGGSVDMVAANKVTVSGPIRAGGGINNSGGYATGGSMTVFAGCGGVLFDDVDEKVDLTGGDGGGGDLVIESDGPVTIATPIDAQGRKLGGDGGLVAASSGRLLTLQTNAVINVNGHDGAANGEDGRGGIVLLQGCQVDVLDTSSAGASVTALGAYGGSSSIEGSKALASSTDYSVRVGDKANIDVTGNLTAGSAFLEVAQRRLGKCSNNLNATCQTASQCVYGCTTGTCDFANPDTQGLLSQFHPTVTIEQATGMYACSSTCP